MQKERKNVKPASELYSGKDTAVMSLCSCKFVLLL